MKPSLGMGHTVVMSAIVMYNTIMHAFLTFLTTDVGHIKVLLLLQSFWCKESANCTA